MVCLMRLVSVKRSSIDSMVLHVCCCCQQRLPHLTVCCLLAELMSMP